ncbi:MAG: antibiotic biosynthesis monooxygenase [Erysipelothrix sp.]|jgi:quinol monooxygenase YgiN|nr:antibiotic biosynthesis monooxygenase [Erysipelothrix sp.]
MKYSINGYITATTGKREELLKYLLEAANEMKNLDNCQCYIVGTNDEESDNVYVFEVWDNEEAHKASLTLPVFQTLIQKAKPIIAGLKSYPPLKIHGGKGITN